MCSDIALDANYDTRYISVVCLFAYVCSAARQMKLAVPSNASQPNMSGYLYYEYHESEALGYLKICPFSMLILNNACGIQS
jgi:hypothetical protein